MAKPTASERLDHILEAIEEIERHTGDLDLERFKQDRFLRLGVERCLEIISEGSRHIPNSSKESAPDIPWRRIADIGNRIRHAYHAIDSEIIWEIVSVEMKTLKAALLEMKQAAK